ncbi:MAG: helix-turn-helix domain-containing protein [Azovibrio sp.]|uniref:helix-turn-helix domain-containing protein n=1 Tax=Azovibrio sp. TaxID=1872673 RepID=UPI003C793971
MTKSKTQAALELIDNGMTPYAAAQEMGIDPSTVYRAMGRRQDKDVCPSCGQVVREGFEINRAVLKKTA